MADLHGAETVVMQGLGRDAQKTQPREGHTNYDIGNRIEKNVGKLSIVAEKQIQKNIETKLLVGKRRIKNGPERFRDVL